MREENLRAPIPEALDDFYSRSLGCSCHDLRAGRSIIVENDLGSIRFAKGAPLAIYALIRPASGAVVAVEPELGALVREVIPEAHVLDDATCDAIEGVVASLVSVDYWFRGIRLYCTPESFRDCAVGEVREILPQEDERTRLLWATWGGKVFGRMVGGQVVSWAAVKPFSDVVWDLFIETLPGHRGQGHAKSAASVAVKHIIAAGRLAGWGCERTDDASLGVARALGFLPYALDFGCVESS